MASTKKKSRRTARKGRAATEGAAQAFAGIEPGPRKKRVTTPPPARLSLHKKRAAWFRSRVSWPLREGLVDKLTRERARALRTLPAAKTTAKWTLAGPTNIGGRCTALACDPKKPDRILIGSAGGGVWASDNAGRTWRASWKAKAPLEIGALAIDPADPQVVYCGTGEANLSADSYPGDGLYKSTDGGKTWKRIGDATKNVVPRRIGTIAIDPFDSKHVVVGGVGYGRQSADNDMGGLYTSHDAGATWTRESFVSPLNYWGHSVVFDPSTQGVAFASVTGPGAKSGIYRTTDGGANWVQLTKTLPPSDEMGRASLAIAPSNPKVVYAVVSDARSDSADRLLGIFRSANGGNTWQDISGTHWAKEGQMSYGNAIAVDPKNANRIVCGGVDLHAWDGKNWTAVSKWDAERGTARYAHADHHAVVMPAAAPGRIYDANDGGLDVSEDGAGSWANRSAGLAVTMFYDIDVAQTDPRLYGGGAQDNGTLITRTGGANTFFELLGGDGGWMVVDPKDASHIYASWQFGGMYRFKNNSSRDVSPPFKDQDNGGIWMVYITIDPNNSNTVYTGNQRVYRTRNDGLSWDALTPVLDGSPISAIEVAAADSKVVYVATENGGFFRTLDGGAHWSANLTSPELPGVMITRIETHPANAREVYITVANFGNSHVFRSNDAGSAWLDIDGGRLPDVPHHALLLRPEAPDELYVCNDAGVFMTTDGGKTWANLTGNLPNVMVVDLVYQQATKKLMAATYGRSIWSLTL
jgi:photosystem II stability/assembly factor-like uncharacterized protein